MMMIRTRRLRLYTEALAASGQKGLTTDEAAEEMTRRNPSDPISKWAANRLKNAAGDKVVQLPGRRYALRENFRAGGQAVPIGELSPGDAVIYNEIHRSGPEGATTSQVDERLGHLKNRRTNYAFSRLKKAELITWVGRAEDGKGIYAASCLVKPPSDGAPPLPEAMPAPELRAEEKDAETAPPKECGIELETAGVKVRLPCSATPEFIADVASRLNAIRPPA